jgi:hypothetical protein
VKKERKVWLGTIGGGVLFAAGLGYWIHTLDESIGLTRGEITAKRDSIISDRQLIEGTSSLEREVIVQREMSAVIRNILPDNEDMNNWVRTIQDFSEESGVRIRGFKEKTAGGARNRKDTQRAFDEVTYAFTLEADAFQLLDYFDMVETHKRFMRVPTFKISAAQRASVEESGFASHKVNLDIQTFVYEPQADSTIVKIEGYERKRDLMNGEIDRRRQELSFSSYAYRGIRGRRDPFVDPRVPTEGGSVLSVPEQMEMVQALVDEMVGNRAVNERVKLSENVIDEMMARADLEQGMAFVEESVRRIEEEGSITYLPSRRRFQLEVVDVLFALREEIGGTRQLKGPSVERLREILEAMNRHFDFEEYNLALDAFRLVADQLEYIEVDPLRKPFVDRLRRKALIARIVRDFEEIELDIRGIALMEGSPSVVHVNGHALSIGDMLDQNLIINEIRTDEIEFIYRGVVLARRF